MFWIADNGSSHAGQASVQRMHQTWLTAELVHLPIRASWLKARRLRRPDALKQRLLGYESRYSATARPFNWR